MATDDFFGEVISSYSSLEAIEDGILMPNPSSEIFKECNIITCALWEKLEETKNFRNQTRVFPLETFELLISLLNYAKEIYDNKKFEGDNDKDFFVIPPTDEGLTVWFVRNETGKLTAMLPSDY